MIIHIIPLLAYGVGKVGKSYLVSDTRDEIARAFTEKVHAFYPTKLSRKLLDILDHDDTKHTGFVLKQDTSFDDIKNKIENLGEIGLATDENGAMITTITAKDGIEKQVDFVIIAREDVKDKIINALLGDCTEIVNGTPKQPITALGQLVRATSNRLPDSIGSRLPSFLRGKP